MIELQHKSGVAESCKMLGLVGIKQKMSSLKCAKIGGCRNIQIFGVIRKLKFRGWKVVFKCMGCRKN